MFASFLLEPLQIFSFSTSSTPISVEIMFLFCSVVFSSMLAGHMLNLSQRDVVVVDIDKSMLEGMCILILQPLGL